MKNHDFHENGPFLKSDIVTLAAIQGTTFRALRALFGKFGKIHEFERLGIGAETNSPKLTKTAETGVPVVPRGVPVVPQWSQQWYSGDTVVPAVVQWSHSGETVGDGARTRTTGCPIPPHVYRYPIPRHPPPRVHTHHWSRYCTPRVPVSARGCFTRLLSDTVQGPTSQLPRFR